MAAAVAACLQRSIMVSSEREVSVDRQSRSQCDAANPRRRRSDLVTEEVRLHMAGVVAGGGVLRVCEPRGVAFAA